MSIYGTLQMIWVYYFMVVWEHDPPGSSPSRIMRRLFDGSGNPIGGSEIALENDAAPSQSDPDISCNANSKCVVVFFEGMGNTTKIFAKIFSVIFDTGDIEIDKSLQVNALGNSINTAPGVKVDLSPDGSNFAVCWAARNGANQHVYYRVFRTENGIPVFTSEREVAASSDSGPQAAQANPEVAYLTNGKVVVTWEAGPNNNQIKASILDPLNSDDIKTFTVSPEDQERHQDPSIARTDKGFIIAWDVNSEFIYVKEYDNEGTELGPPMILCQKEKTKNTETTIAHRSSIDTAVAWKEENREDDGDFDIVMQGIPTSCITEDDCANSLYGNLCKNGKCGPCKSNEECQEDQYCVSGKCVDCEDNDNCPPNHDCVSGKCVPKDDGNDDDDVPANPDCATNTDCMDPLASFCDDGQCTPCIYHAHCAHIPYLPKCKKGQCVRDHPHRSLRDKPQKMCQNAQIVIRK